MTSVHGVRMTPGQFYICSNSKFVHPTKMAMDALGVYERSGEVMCWHVRDCTGDHGKRSNICTK